jgi:transcriptional regulator with XRE-family HTH domain
MSAARVPTVPQQRLGAALRQLRDDRGFSSEEVGEQLGWSASKISRIETARIGTRVSDVRTLLDLYGVEEHRREELLGLTYEAGRKGWWASYVDLPPEYAYFIALENEADSVLEYDNHVVPGIMQTEEYARQVIFGSNAFTVSGPKSLARRLHVRMRRQRLLQPPRSLRMSVVIDESVLLRRIGDNTTMADQLAHLIELVQLSNVSLRVLPLSGIHSPIVGPFTLLRFAPFYDIDFPDTVYLESVSAAYSQVERVTHEYRLAFTSLAEQALSPRESIQLISRSQRRWR